MICFICLVSGLLVCIFNRNFIFEKLKLFWVIIQENIILSLKGSLNNLFFEKYLKAVADYPAFLRFLTKKSFSLLRTSSFDFSNSFLISGFKSFLPRLDS
tara:strand:- start:121 stop:420 length:300 start_codon:yes stop_codon:yes gene_type:complete